MFLICVIYVSLYQLFITVRATFERTLDCFSFALLRYVIGPENLRHPLMQPIKFKTMTNRDLATRVFPRFKYVVFFFAFSLAFCDNLFCFVG